MPIVDLNGNPAGNLVVTTQCKRRWTYGGAVSPAGFQLNVLSGRRLQPYLLGTLGVLATTRPIPAEQGTAVNFLVQVGVGLEFYRTAKHSMFAEYRVQHFSNDDRSNVNPGVDSQVVHVGLSFGR